MWRQPPPAAASAMVQRDTIRRNDDVGPLWAAPAEDTDATLLRQAARGDTLAFERIAWRYDEVILAFLLTLTASEQEALELCRATFLAAYQDLARREGESLYIWLYRLAVTQWLARRRAKRNGSTDALSPREQLVFTLRARQHLALETIAKILDLQAEDAGQIFCRAVGKLRLRRSG
jgi:DNA-directed RNA polymerase specialized sigma24 family protein